MKAIVQHRYGPPDQVLRVEEVDKPEPGPEELLVRVHAASVHADVWHAVSGFPRILRLMGGGVRRPSQPIPGTDMAGVVEAVGDAVSDFAVGDKVFGQTVGENQWRNGGTFAEYTTIRVDRAAKVPDGVSLEEAAAVPTSGLIAHRTMLIEGGVKEGDRVLVNGAGGALGVFALQLAKAKGAHVTAVDHGGKLDALLALGADEVIDFQTTDYTQTDNPYDIIYDVASNRSFRDVRRALNPAGPWVLIGHDHYGTVGRRTFGSVPRVLGLALLAPFSPHLIGFTRDERERNPLEELATMMGDGHLRPAVGRTFPLENAVAALEALRHRALVGKVVLQPTPFDEPQC